MYIYEMKDLIKESIKNLIDLELITVWQEKQKNLIESI